MMAAVAPDEFCRQVDAAARKHSALPIEIAVVAVITDSQLDAERVAYLSREGSGARVIKLYRSASAALSLRHFIRALSKALDAREILVSTSAARCLGVAPDKGNAPYLQRLAFPVLNALWGTGFDGSLKFIQDIDEV